ncbi:MAG: hypothetical protein Q9171_007289 [Xanthocarpia ochracea]
MQTLWARIAQSRCSCNCSSCLSSATNVSRRTAAAPIRRRLGADDVFAAFFSTVAFASAVADSNRKDAKREEWIRVIKEARRDLRALKADQQRRISNLAHPVPPALPAPHEERSTVDAKSWVEVLDWGEEEIRDRRALGFEDWQGLPLDVLRTASRGQIEDLLRKYTHHFPRFKSSYGPDVWSTVTWPYHIKKMKTLEWSIAQLAMDLMSGMPESQAWSLSNVRGVAEEVMSQLSIVTIDEIASRRVYISHLLGTLARRKDRDEYFHHFESPKYPNYSGSEASLPNAADQLNEKLHSLLEHTTDGRSTRITELLPKICYYLLTSSSPPNIHTYNLLISEFAGARRDDLIHCLLRSMYRTHMRSNEITLAETLRHYVRTKDRFRFDRHVQRMAGFEEGLEEAHPQLDIPELLKFQYRVRVTRYFTDQPPVDEYHELSDLDESDLLALKKEAKIKVYQKARCNLEVHQALIHGALFFHGTYEAIKHYRTMVSEGWEPDQEILLGILRYCILDLEWEAGCAIWRRLQAFGTSMDERGVALMLQLCQRCNKHEGILETLRYCISQGILPPTVLEIGWHDAAMYEDAQDVLKGFGVAKDMWILKEGLHALLRGLRTDYGITREDSKHVFFITNQIERSLRRPTPDTISLLHEARSYAATDHKSSLLDTKLLDSGEHILAMVSEFHDVRFSMKVKRLEATLLEKLSTIAQWVKECRSMLFSIRLRGHEDRAAATTRFIEESRTQVISINTRIIPGKVRAIGKQIGDIQYGISRYVVAYFVAHVRTLHGRMGIVSARIRGTSIELSIIIRSIQEEAVRHGSAERSSIQGKFPTRITAGHKQVKRIDKIERPSQQADVAKLTLSIPVSKTSPIAQEVHGQDSASPKADELQAQPQSQGQVLKIKRLQDARPTYDPFVPTRKLTIADVEVGLTGHACWRQQPSDLDLIHPSNRTDPVSVYELEHA